MWEKTITVGILTGVITGDLVLAGVISLLFGIISAAQQYNKARHDDDLTYDWLDFSIAVLSSVGAGGIGFLGAGVLFDNGHIQLIITGLMSVAGFKGMELLVLLGKDYLGNRYGSKNE